ncbi:MAG: hypothetical protein ACP5NC_05010 [Nitrososphaeria archaeon]
MDFALYFSLKSLNVFGLRLIEYLMASAFFLILAINEYPLIFVFYISIFLLIGIPVSLYLKSKVKFLITIISVPLLYFLFDDGIVLFSVVKGSSSISYSTTAIHVLNLVYYENFIYLKSLGALFGITGLNSLYSGSYLYYFAIPILALLAIMAFFSTRKKGLTLTLFFILIIIIGINMPVSGQTAVSYIVVFLIKTHIIRFNHFGFLATIFDGNRETLIVYWYVFVSALTLVLFELPEMGASNKKLKGIKRYFNKTHMARMGALPFLLVLVILLLSFGQFTLSTSQIMPISSSPSINYVINSKTVNYNQYIFLQNTHYWSSQYIFNPSQVMSPVGNDYPFYMELLNVENSPYLNYFERSFPPSTLLLSDTHNIYFANNLGKVSSFKVLTNFNNSNVVLGDPVFVVGSAEAYNSFMENYLSGINVSPSYNTAVPVKLDGVTYEQIPGLSSLNKFQFIESHFNVSGLNISQLSPNGVLNVGIASNSSNPYGYGVGNSFFGIFISNNPQRYLSGYGLSGKGWLISIMCTNSSSWYDLGQIPIFSNTLNLSFTIIQHITANSDYFYLNILGNWYSFHFYNSFPKEHYTLLEYRENDPNVSVNVTTKYFSPPSHVNNYIPVFYDSPFTSFQSFIKSLNSSQFIIIGNGYNPNDLYISYLIFSGKAGLVTPSSYAIDFPGSGWFQVFSSNDPQGAFYSENVPSNVLPVQGFYGQATGFAESISGNESLKVPIGSTVRPGSVIALNVLFSPVGGNLSIVFGNESFNINTFSVDSSYRWVDFYANSTVDSVTLKNLNGVQSVNLIAYFSKNDLLSAENFVNSLLKGKAFVDSGMFRSNNVTASGTFDANAYQSSIFLHGKINGPVVVVIPHDYPLGESLRINNASGLYVPVWGSFTGILIWNYASNEAVIKLTNYQYFTGIESYLPLFIIFLIAIYEKIKG